MRESTCGIRQTSTACTVLRAPCNVLPAAGDETRSLIIASGAIPSLVRLLSAADPIVYAPAAGALCNLAIHGRCHSRLGPFPLSLIPA